MSRVACIYILDARAVSVVSAVFEQAVNRKDQHVATKQQKLLSCRRPYRQKAKVHGACLPWERFQRAFRLCLHN